MNSIYGRLFAGFFITLILSFSITSIVAIRRNFSTTVNMAYNELRDATAHMTSMMHYVDQRDWRSALEEYGDTYDLSFAVTGRNNFSISYGELNKDFFLTSAQRRELIEKNREAVASNGMIYCYAKAVKINDKYYIIQLQTDVTEASKSITSSYMLSAIIMFIAGSVVFLIVADLITRPITNLTKATEELSKGNYDVRVVYSGNSEMAQLNRAFNQMAVQMGKQEEMRQQFISDVSHEFQTPLTAIQGFATILRNEDLPDELREKYADIITFNAKRLSTLSKNMLQLTLLEREDVELEVGEFSLIDQLNRVIEMEDDNALSKDIEIEFIKPRGDILIEADEARLEQVWLNLISNAIKYTNEHGVITVEVKRLAREITVSVADTGVGMSKEDLSHIFNRFYRVDKSRAVEGNGLGLSIVKRIVDLHKYTIDVQSQEDVGSVFTVHIPIERFRNLFNINKE